MDNIGDGKPSVNWTTQTTWYKWVFTDYRKMFVIVFCAIFHICIYFNWDNFVSLPVWAIVLFIILFDIGTILIIITSILDWKNAKKQI